MSEIIFRHVGNELYLFEGINQNNAKVQMKFYGVRKPISVTSWKMIHDEANLVKEIAMHICDPLV